MRPCPEAEPHNVICWRVWNSETENELGRGEGALAAQPDRLPVNFTVPIRFEDIDKGQPLTPPMAVSHPAI